MIDALILDKIVRYCTYSERCTQDVVKKLYSLKVDKAMHEVYIKNLREHKFLDDARYAKSYVHAYTENKKQGKIKVQMALQRKGIDSALIKELLRHVVDENYNETINALVEKKWNSIRTGTGQQKKIKVLRFLLGRGYAMADIKKAVDEISKK